MVNFGSIDWNAITAITAVAVAVMTAIIQILESRRARLALQTEIVLNLEENFFTEDMRKSRKTAASKLMGATYPNPELTKILDFFSRAAMLVESKALDLSLTYKMQEYWITRYWHCGQKHIKQVRTKDHAIWSTLERLVNKLMAYREARGHPLFTDEQLADFLKEEANAW